MGNLSEGTPIPWPELKKFCDHVRENGIEQLIHLFQKLKDREKDGLKWGDEVECMLVEFDDDAKTAKLSLTGKEALVALNTAASSWDDSSSGTAKWVPEFGRYMVESTPGEPYEADLKSFLRVEQNMALRRAQSRAALPNNIALMTLTVFPRLGCVDFTSPRTVPSPGGDVAKSLFFPDEAINEHPRFAALASNIRRRRGRKVEMNVPIFHDENTPSPFVEDFGELHEGDPEGGKAAKEDHIYMDAMGFGMGNSCLQVTFQATCINQAKELYDHLCALCPIVLALSAAAPVFRGFLSDVDCRWNVISNSVDCRTPQELGEEPLSDGAMRIDKSRYASISSFLADNDQNRDEYEDVPLELNEAVLKQLLDAGFTPRLARHFAHLFIRDPMVVYKEYLDQDNENDTDHFENIQSTNWQTMRFKPPPPDSDIGWRIEFRPCEVQLTDFENAAFSVFIVLLTRTILSFNLNLYMPISKIDENMERAHARDALNTKKFWFRRYLSDERPVAFDDSDDEHDDNDNHNEREQQQNKQEVAEEPMSAQDVMAAVHAKLVDHKERLGTQTTTPTTLTGKCAPTSICEEYKQKKKEEGKEEEVDLKECTFSDCIMEEFTVNELINGADGGFVGFVPLVKQYIRGMDVDIDTRCVLDRYLAFVSDKAAGKIPTTATYIREYIQAHTAYAKDSVVSDEIAFDMLKHFDGISNGTECAKGLLGRYCKCTQCVHK
eukprot:m.213929 g.213929  ORF g.213929 m.213929 type:complete len:721 (-) comp13796_c0_seq1:742-2904(-)